MRKLNLILRIAGCLFWVVSVFAGGGGSDPQGASRSVKAGIASVDAISGQMDITLPLGPTLPGRIPVGISWHHESGRDVTVSGTSSATLATFAGNSWPAYPDATTYAGSTIGTTWGNRVYVTLNHRRLTFLPSAVSSTQVIQWLRDRGVDGSGDVPSGLTQIIDKVMVSPDGSTFLVASRWSAGAATYIRTRGYDDNGNLVFTVQPYIPPQNFQAARLIVITGDLATWAARTGSGTMASLTELRNRWGDWARVSQEGVPMTRLALSNNLGNTITLDASGTTWTISNNMGFANWTITGTAPAYTNSGSDPFESRHQLQTVSDAVRGLQTTLVWDATIQRITSISAASGLTHTFTWGDYATASPAAEGFASSLDGTPIPNEGDWKGYEPVHYLGSIYAIGQKRTGISLIAATSNNAAEPGMAIQFFRNLPQPTGYSNQTISWSSTTYKTEIRTYSNPNATGDYRFLRLIHAEPGSLYGTPSQPLANQRQMALFAMSAVVREDSGTNEGGIEVLRKRITHDAFSLKSPTNGNGDVVGLVSVDPFPTRTIVEFPQGDGPTKVQELLSWDGRHFAQVRTVTLPNGSSVPYHDGFGHPASAYWRGTEIPIGASVNGNIQQTQNLVRTWNGALAVDQTNQTSNQLDGSDYAALRGASSVDLGTKTYGYDSLGRTQSVTGTTGVFTSTASMDYGGANRPEPASTTRYLTQGATAAPLSGRVGEAYTYSGLWRVTTQQLPDGRTVQEGRDSLGRLVSITNEDGVQTINSFDSLGRLYQSTRQAKGIVGSVYTRTEWDPAGRWVREYTPGQTSGEVMKETDLDAFGRILSVTTAKGTSAERTIYRTYDGFGQMVSESLPTKAGATPKYKQLIYATDGFLLQTVNTRGAVTANFVRPTWGVIDGVYGFVTNTQILRRVGTTEALRNTYDLKDLLGQVVRHMDELGQIRAMSYDAYGRVTQIRQGSQVRGYSFNDMGWLLSQTQPEEGTTTFSGHTVTGTPLSIQKGGATTSLTLFSASDGGNREGLLKSVTVSAPGGLGSSISRNMDYYTNRKLASFIETQANGSISETYLYDDIGRPVSKTTSDGSVAFSVSQELDAFGKVTKVNYPVGGGRAARFVQPSYDSAYRLNSVAFESSNVATMFYDATTSQTDSDRLVYANGAYTTWERNADQELSHVVHTAAGSTVEDSYVSWSNDGLMISRGADSFQYDALGRLTSAVVTGPTGQSVQQSYGYDLYGNRTSVGSTSLVGQLPAEAINFALSIGADNRIPSTTTTGISTGAQYDGLGRMSQVWAVPGDSSTLTSWSYDASGRVVAQGGSVAYTESYLLDSAGLRFRKNTNDGTTIYTVYGFGKEPLSVFQKPGGGSLAWSQDQVYGFGQLLLEKRGSTLIYQQGDHLGTPSVLTNAAGSVVGRQKSLPFGERMTGNGMSSFRRFTNHEDGAQYPIHMQARMYLPTYGRFAEVDPAYDHSRDGLNLYSYVSNNPVTKTDPDGMREAGVSPSRAIQPQTPKPNPCAGSSNATGGIGIEWEAGFGKTDTHGFVGGSLSATASGFSPYDVHYPNGLSGQVTTSVPAQATVYGAAFSVGKNITFGNAAGAGDFSGITHNRSVTLGFFQLTYGTSDSGVKQYSFGFAAGLSFSKYDTYTASKPIVGTQNCH